MIKNTVIITAEKKDQTIIKTIQSCLKQTNKNLEIIVAYSKFEDESNIKKNIKSKKNKNKYLLAVKKDLQKRVKIKIDYLELRNIDNLKLSNVIDRSRLFVSYYLNGVRLIDNL